jgi:hypothetical protein
MSAVEWRPIPGWEGLYEASSDGQIRSLDRPNSRGRLRKGRVLSPGISPKGYTNYSLYRDAKRFPANGHVLIAATFLGPRPPGMQVAHADGVKTNNAVSNLRYATPVENAADKKIHGTEWNANKTHCPQGHAYTPDNLRKVAHPSRGRQCKACGEEWQRNRRARLKAADAA